MARNYNRYMYQTRKRSYKAFLESLPDDYDLNQVDKYGETILNAAIGNKNIDLVKILIDKGVDINGDRKADLYPLEIAALNGAYDIVRLLCNNTNLIINRDDDIALTCAAMTGYNNIIDILLDKGYDVKKSIDGRTALHWAVQEHHFDTVKHLISKGANVNFVDRTNDYNQESAISIACGEFSLGYTDKDNALSIIEILLQAGADINSIDNNGDTELIYAVIYLDIDLVKRLVEKGADINISNNEGRSALFYAYLRKEYNIAQYLIDYGADNNIIDIYGNTIDDLKDEAKRKKIFVEWYYSEDDNIDILE